MTTAVSDLVTQAIYDRLSGAVEAVEVVMPEQLPSFSPQNNQVVIVPGNSEPVPELSCPGNPPAIAYQRPYVIICVVVQDEEALTSIDSLLAEFSAAVIATMTEATDWHNWGGNAMNSTLGGTERVISDTGSTAEHRVSMVVTYRVSETNPYQRR